MIIRYFAIAGILFTALWLGRGYSSFADKRLNEYSSFSALLLHMEGEISRSLGYGRSLFRSFSDEYLEKCGFLPLLREGKKLSDAFEECKIRLTLSKEIKDSLGSVFVSFGKGYMEEEVTRLKACRAELEDVIKRESELLEKNKKVVNALLFGVAASGAIILI